MNVDAMIKHHQAVTEVITHAMSDYASAATGTSWNKACFAFEADAILCALSRAGFRILGPDEVDPVTVERCVEVAAATDPEKPANWLHRREEIAAAIRALSSPDHADAGKVEGDGWLPIESAPKDGTLIDLWSDEYGRLTDCYWGAPMAYEGGETGWVHAHSNEWAESPDEFVHWRPLPSAPSEGAE